MDSKRLEMLKQIAQALAAQFGPGCEVVIHDLAAKDPEKSIVYIVNGHVTGRRVGDGPFSTVIRSSLPWDASSEVWTSPPIAVSIISNAEMS